MAQGGMAAGGGPADSVAEGEVDLRVSVDSKAGSA